MFAVEGNLSQGGFNLGTVLGAEGVSVGLAVWDMVAVTPWSSTPQEAAGGEGVVHEIPSYSCSPLSQKLHGERSFPSWFGVVALAQKRTGRQEWEWPPAPHLYKGWEHFLICKRDGFFSPEGVWRQPVPQIFSANAWFMVQSMVQTLQCKAGSTSRVWSTSSVLEWQRSLG